MYPKGNLFIPVSHGRLEAIIKDAGHSNARGTALVLHPHPLFGGTMHNKVVFRAAAALNQSGLVALRINFRGVGESTGKHDHGSGEAEDVKAGLDFLAENYSGSKILLCGFSFGARVGIEVGIKDPRVGFLVSIGTPLNSYDFTFLQQCLKPILFVHGEQDEHGSIDELRKLVSEMEKNTEVRLVVIPGADHFFEGHLDEMKQAITSWVTEKLNNPHNAQTVDR